MVSSVWHFAHTRLSDAHGHVHSGWTSILVPHATYLSIFALLHFSFEDTHRIVGLNDKSSGQHWLVEGLLLRHGARYGINYSSWDIRKISLVLLLIVFYSLKAAWLLVRFVQLVTEMSLLTFGLFSARFKAERRPFATIMCVIPVASLYIGAQVSGTSELCLTYRKTSHFETWLKSNFIFYDMSQLWINCTHISC